MPEAMGDGDRRPAAGPYPRNRCPGATTGRGTDALHAAPAARRDYRISNVNVAQFDS